MNIHSAMVSQFGLGLLPIGGFEIVRVIMKHEPIDAMEKSL